MPVYLIRGIGRFSLLLSIVTSVIGCGPKLPKSTNVATALTTITVDKFLKNNATNEPCYTTKSGPVLIDYLMTVSIRYYDQPTNTWPVLAQTNNATYSPGASGVRQPVVFHLNIPTKVFYKVEVSVIGKQCSTCANGWGGTSNNGVDQCVAYHDVIANNYVAAVPKWFGSFSYNNYQSTISINGIPQDFNVDHSCGCTVNP